MRIVFISSVKGRQRPSESEGPRPSWCLGLVDGKERQIVRGLLCRKDLADAVVIILIQVNKTCK